MRWLRRPLSIQTRLTAAYTAILALTFALTGIGVWLALNHSIEETADRELYSRLKTVRHYVDGFSPDDLLHLEEEFREESLLTTAAANIRISDGHGKWLFRTPGTEDWPNEALRQADLTPKGRIRTIRRRHEIIRVLVAPVKVGVVEIGLPVDEFEEVKSGFLWLIALGSPVILLLAWMGGYWMSGRALGPVDEISRAAAGIGARELSARLPGNGAGDELDRLSSVLNTMLARLESSFRRITEFTADASHELRTPVAIIQTTGELMLARLRSNEEHVKAWRTVVTETERTSRLIADLLTLARTDAGKSSMDVQLIDITGIVRSASEEMRIMAESKGLTLTVDASTPISIEGDADALRRAICILLDNAIKFTPVPGKIRIEARWPASVTVTDTGIGIPADELPRIFERFYRTSKDRSRETGGTGLGLSIAAWIVEQHGGLIKVESTPGLGSIFTIQLNGLR